MCGRAHQTARGYERTAGHPPAPDLRLGDVRVGGPCAVYDGEAARRVRWGWRVHSERLLAHARVESLLTGSVKPTFRGPLGSARCALPVDAWWEKGTAFSLPDGRPAALPALWREGAEGPCIVLVTRPAGPDVAPVHQREPAAILGRKALAAWLAGSDPALFSRPAPAGTWLRDGRSAGPPA